MYSTCWQIIKDDSKRTFEVCGKATNTNSFTNQVVSLQRAGMNVSFATPPVTNKNSSKSLVKVSGRKDRGVRRARFMTVLREQRRPAALVEGGFLSSAEEGKLILDPTAR